MPFLGLGSKNKKEKDTVKEEKPVSGEIVYPSGSHVLLGEDTSYSNGVVSYSWKINDNAEPGIYSIKLRSSASGYKPSSATITFQVT